MTPTLERIGDVVRRTTLPKASIYRDIATGAFPKPIQIGPKRVAWLSAEVDAWIERCAAERKPAVAQK